MTKQQDKALRNLEELPHGPTVFNQYRNGDITAVEARRILGMTKGDWKAYVHRMSHWCHKQFIYQDCCNYIDRISSEDFKAYLLETLINYSEDELVETSIFGITSIINQAHRRMMSKEGKASA